MNEKRHYEQPQICHLTKGSPKWGEIISALQKEDQKNEA